MRVTERATYSKYGTTYAVFPDRFWNYYLRATSCERETVELGLRLVGGECLSGLARAVQGAVAGRGAAELPGPNDTRPRADVPF